MVRGESLPVRSWVVSLKCTVYSAAVYGLVLPGAQSTPASSGLGVGAFDPLAVWLGM